MTSSYGRSALIQCSAPCYYWLLWLLTLAQFARRGPPAPVVARQRRRAPVTFSPDADRCRRRRATDGWMERRTKADEALLLRAPWPGVASGGHVAGAAHKGRHRILLTSHTTQPPVALAPFISLPPGPHPYSISCPLPFLAPHTVDLLQFHTIPAGLSCSI